MLHKLVNLLSNSPMKLIFVTIIMVVLLVFGARNIFMATGNDTLVKDNSDVYKDNLMLEEEFGGESIIVLYESDELLTPDNLHHMKGIENALQMNDSIYSILSPVTLVEEIANNQSNHFKDGISEIIDGLDEMGKHLEEVGENLAKNTVNQQEIALPELKEPELPKMEAPSSSINNDEMDSLPELGNISLPDMKQQAGKLNEGFSNLIGAQKNLKEGTSGLTNGFNNFAEQIKESGHNIKQLAEEMENTSVKQQLAEDGQRLMQLSQQMIQLSEESKQLAHIPDQTIDGLNNIQNRLDEQFNQQDKQMKQISEQITKQHEMKKKIQVEQEEKQKQMEQEIQQKQIAQQEAMQLQLNRQKSEKESEIQQFKDEMAGKQEEQKENLEQLSDGLTEVSEKLIDISENMESIYSYSDIMTPGLPTTQATLDKMIYEEDDTLRPMFGEVIIDQRYMTMMITLNGDIEDSKKTEVLDTINHYLNTTELKSAETIVSGKPVLDHATRSSMQGSIQMMMGLALAIMVLILTIIFKVRWRLLPLLTVLIAVIGTVGFMGWLQIPITMVSMAVFPILIGLGIDYAIQFQNRYAEELAKEDLNE